MPARLLLLLLAAVGPALAAEPLFPFMRKLKLGFIDARGRVAIEPRFDPQLREFERAVFEPDDALYPVAENGVWGYIDRSGAVRVPFRFDMAEFFHEGLAAVRVRLPGGSGGGGVAPDRWRWGYLDSSGQSAIEPRFESAGPFSEGLAAVDGGYIDKTGALVIRGASGGGFSAGLAVVCLPANAAPRVATGDGGFASPREPQCGYLDRTGAWKIEPGRYRYPGAFREGLAMVTLADGSGVQFIRPSGEVALGPFGSAGDFSEGLAYAVLRDASSGFIDTTGKSVFPLRDPWMRIEPYSGGLAKVTIRNQEAGERDDKVGYLDRSGRFAIPPVYDSGSSFRHGLAHVSRCGESGYIDASNRSVFGLRSAGAASRKASSPPPAAARLTPAALSAAVGSAASLTVKPVPLRPGQCSHFGKPFWAIAVEAPDKTRVPDFEVHLVEGGSFLSEERIENLSAFESLSGPAGLAFALGPRANPAGYFTVLGFGPGGALYAAAVFSPDKSYELLLMFGQGEGVPPMKEDPRAWSERVALRLRAALFGGSGPIMRRVAGSTAVRRDGVAPAPARRRRP